MTNKFVENLKKDHLSHSTEELLDIWQTKGTQNENSTEECFEAIRQILVERGIDPATKAPASWADDLGVDSALINDAIKETAHLVHPSEWSYETARGVALIISSVGWLFVGLCTVAAVRITIICKRQLKRTYSSL
jgi:hypothetical protein